MSKSVEVKRRKYCFTRAQKISILNELNIKGVNLSELARKYQINSVVLYRWRKRMEMDMDMDMEFKHCKSLKGKLGLLFKCLNINRWILFGPLFLIVFFTMVPAEAKDEGSFHICYFSLNNEKEFTEMERFTKKLNEHSSYPITIAEYMTERGDPEESFLKMVETGERCDGLVISGHHTGSFGGERVHGSLGIDFLEKLSCDERYGDWFNHIKAVWLQGCRTLGTGDIVPDAEEVSADYHTRRVGEMLDVDHLEQSFADLNVEFSATLDQDNPLSSRYLRVFPGANIFGWTETAPGKLVGSQYSVPFHIAHLAKRLDEEDRFPSEGPLERRWTEESALKYRESLISILDGGEQCGPEEVLGAWKSHGEVTDQSTGYGFLNPDLQAYPALLRTDDEILKQARLYDCLLKNSEGEKLLEVLDQILRSPIFIRYTYNSLLNRLQAFRGKDDEEYSGPFYSPGIAKVDKDIYLKMIEKLKSNPEMNAFLSEKLTSRSLGILRKIDYYAFYEEIYGKQDQIRAVILSKAQENFSQIPSHSRDEVDYKRTLFRSLAKHGYLKNEQGKVLLKRVMEDPSRLLRRSAAWEMRRFEEEAFSFVQVAMKSSNPYLRASAVLLAGFIYHGKMPKAEAVSKGIIEKGLKDVVEVRVAVVETAVFLAEEGEKLWRVFWELAGDSDEEVLAALMYDFDVVVEVIKVEQILPLLAKVWDHLDDEFIREEIVGDVLEDIIMDQIEFEDSLPLFEKLLSDRSWYVREEAIYILGYIDDPALLPFLREILDDPDLRLQKEEISDIEDIIESF